MKCPHGDGWTGPFKRFGGHMARSHRRIMLKNLKKAHSPAAKRKAAETRRRNRAVDAPQTHKKASGKTERNSNSSVCPECGNYKARSVETCGECRGINKLTQKQKREVAWAERENAKSIRAEFGAPEGFIVDSVTYRRR